MRKNSILVVLLVMALPSISCSIINSVLRGAKRPNNLDNSTPVASKTPEKPSFKDFQAKAKDIGSISAPLKLNTAAKVKGKVAIIEKTEYGNYSMKGFEYDGSDYYQFDLDNYALQKEKLATKPEEIETLILKSCDKGKQIGRYSLTDGRKIPALALNCKVSIIDYQIPAIIAQKKFFSKNLPESIQATNSTTEYTAIEPYTEINEYIKSFPRE